MTPYPLLFHPILKQRVWGGRSLAALGKPLPRGTAIGESWEVADLPETIEGGRSTIANGPLAGRTLREAIAEHREAILGAAKLTPEGGFPLLIKYLDARENLSVQVHPDEAYVARHPEAHLKSEAWIIMSAEPGAVIYKGVKPEVTREQFAHHLESERVIDDLVAVPVAPGECHYLPSGTCHALGGGIVAAEIQTPSDTTFRVYDWGRQGRELHVEQALECIRFGRSSAEPPPQRKPIKTKGIQTTPLVETSYFAIERIAIEARVPLEVVTSGMPLIWMILTGRGRVETDNAPTVDLTPGTTALMPAELNGGVAVLEPESSLLWVSLPSPLKGLLA
jgi:mannose-6-phosphate isomerase